jgi:hypothetical protein
MSQLRNITVAVPDELYRQTRRLAAENNHSVTASVRYLLYCLPKALQAAPIPADSHISAPPDFARAFARAKKNKEPWPPPVQPVPQPKTSGFVRPQIGE